VGHERTFRVGLVLPAFDEEEALPLVLSEVPRELVDALVVVDNGSRDRTAEVARAAGAEVVSEPRRGYGTAVLAGIARLEGDPPDVLVILDADHADPPRAIPTLVGPILRDEADLVQSDRTRTAEPGALTFVQRFGNRLATELIPEHPADLHMVYFGGPDVAGHRFWRQYDPGPFAWSGTSPEADAALADVIPNYYVWVDEMIGELVAAVGEDATVFVISDHGMHEQYVEKPNKRFLSGDHQDGTPGVIIAAGPGIVEQTGAYDRYLRSGAIATLGSVFSVTPTLLALLGIPVGQDMQTRAYEPILTEDVRAAVDDMVRVPTHDEGFRPTSVVEVPAGREEEFIARMRALGYLDLAAPEEEWRLVNPEELEGADGGGADESGD